MSGPPDQMAQIKEAIRGAFDDLLTPQPGEALPRCYVAKRGRGGRGGALALVPRDKTHDHRARDARPALAQAR
jgi:hypothetical protein